MCIRPWFYDQHSAVSRPGDSAPYNSALKELLVRLTGFVRLDGRTSVPRGRQYWPKSVGLPARGIVLFTALFIATQARQIIVMPPLFVAGYKLYQPYTEGQAPMVEEGLRRCLCLVVYCYTGKTNNCDAARTAGYEIVQQLRAETLLRYDTAAAATSCNLAACAQRDINCAAATG